MLPSSVCKLNFVHPGANCDISAELKLFLYSVVTAHYITHQIWVHWDSLINLKVLPKLTATHNCLGEVGKPILALKITGMSAMPCVSTLHNLEPWNYQLVPTQLSAYIDLSPGQHPSCEAIVLYTENHCN